VLAKVEVEFSFLDWISPVLLYLKFLFFSLRKNVKLIADLKFFRKNVCLKLKPYEYCFVKPQGF
jgi:hypothetical protein